MFVFVRRPAPCARLPAHPRLCAPSRPRYQSTRLTLLADGLDITRMAGVTFASEDSSVVKVDGRIARGVAPGATRVRLTANSLVRLDLAVSNTVASVACLYGA